MMMTITTPMILSLMIMSWCALLFHQIAFFLYAHSVFDFITMNQTYYHLFYRRNLQILQNLRMPLEIVGEDSCTMYLPVSIASYFISIILE